MPRARTLRLPGVFDPAAGGGMNNPSGFNNLNPANPATQLLNSNAQQSPSSQIFTKDASRPAAWPSKQAIYWGPSAEAIGAAHSGGRRAAGRFADAVPGSGLTLQRPRRRHPSIRMCPSACNTLIPTNRIRPTSGYPHPAAAPPSYPATGAQPAAPNAGVPGGYAPSASNPPVGYPPPGNGQPGKLPPGYAAAVMHRRRQRATQQRTGWISAGSDRDAAEMRRLITQW